MNEKERNAIPADPDDVVEHGHVREDDPMAATDDGETWTPPTDPVVRPDEHGDAEVVGGFSPSSMENDPRMPRGMSGGTPDEAIADAIRRELREDAATTDLDVTVDVRDGTAHLRGRVDDLVDADDAAAVAGRVPGVADVVDELELEAEG